MGVIEAAKLDSFEALNLIGGVAILLVSVEYCGFAFPSVRSAVIESNFKATPGCAVIIEIFRHTEDESMGVFCSNDIHKLFRLRCYSKRPIHSAR